jgi:hypothetical protein
MSQLLSVLSKQAQTEKNMSEQNMNHLTLNPSPQGGEGKPWEKMTMAEQMSAARDRGVGCGGMGTSTPYLFAAAG